MTLINNAGVVDVVDGTMASVACSSTFVETKK